MILSGGPASVTTEGTPARAAERCSTAGVPILGICYGQQTMAVQLGGEVEGGHAARVRPRRGRDQGSDARCSTASGEVGERYPVWMSHGDRVTQLPEGFTVMATSRERAVRGRRRREARASTRRMFHPEVVHTPDGAKLLANFVHKIAGLQGDWTMAHFRTAEIAKIRAQVGKGARDLRAVGRRRLARSPPC